MPELGSRPFSYRDDPAVPAFDDSKTLFVFDGVCVLCSGGVSWLMRHDRDGRVNFLSAQSPAGAALYRHYGVVIDESYLLLSDGRAYTASAGYLRLVGLLGGWWRVFGVARIFPERLRDAVYALVARNRYRWFGKTEYCALLTEEQRRRLL
jgi:predicted DCC family thiol-disulfide oxidoreductase YuxK